jgi:bifunctional non-homologous end joining protein LigD
MTLSKYREKRNFAQTPEPVGTPKSAKRARPAHIFVVQKHRASQLHYDFRLEYGNVLLSWAIPKGPSLDPSVRRLAMQVEDHPVEYANFEGAIPEGEYGGGTAMVWDKGTWLAESDNVEAALQKGDLKFTLRGKKLRGSWVLVRTRGYGGKSEKSWLLIKHRDRFASTTDITGAKPRSVTTNRLLADIAFETGGNVTKAATGDPNGAKKRPRKAQ